MTSQQLRTTNKVLTGIGYAAYPALLVYVAIMRPSLLPACIIVPAASFLIITGLRALVNTERPYEKGDAPNLLDKQTKGRSFPSRHVASMFIIASSWLLVCEPVGIILCISGLAMGAIRVKGGAHYARDVVAGAVFAFALCAIGYAIAYQPLA